MRGFVEVDPRAQRDRHAQYLSTVDGKLWKLPQLRSIVPLLEEHPRDPKLDAAIGGTRVARSMREEAESLKRKTGLNYSDMQRLGMAYVLKQARKRKRERGRS